MAFVCTLHDGDEVEIHAFTNGSDSVAQVTVGYNDTTDETYSIMAAFSPQGGGDMELAFCLIAVDIEEGTEHRYWTGAETREFIPSADHRRKLLNAICTAVNLLIETLPPARVYHATRGDLPERAIGKHLIVNQLFERAGYIVEEGETVAGCRLWILERAT